MDNYYVLLFFNDFSRFIGSHIMTYTLCSRLKKKKNLYKGDVGLKIQIYVHMHKFSFYTCCCYIHLLCDLTRTSKKRKYVIVFHLHYELYRRPNIVQYHPWTLARPIASTVYVRSPRISIGEISGDPIIKHTSSKY